MTICCRTWCGAEVKTWCRERRSASYRRCGSPPFGEGMSAFSRAGGTCVMACLVATACIGVSSCGRRETPVEAKAQPQAVTVGVTAVTDRPLSQRLTISSELVPFQEIDVYAKEAGYVKRLLVDYGTHVKKGQLMAVLEGPELEAQLQQDEAEIRARNDQVKSAADEVNRVK